MGRTTPPRHIATREEVLKALTEEIEGRTMRPLSAMDLCRHIHAKRGGAHWEQPEVNRGALEKLLLELESEGAVHGKTGKEWAGIAPSARPCRAAGRYYAAPQYVKVWQAEAARRRDGARHKRAMQAAMEALAQLHPAEFDALVAGFLANGEPDA